MEETFSTLMPMLPMTDQRGAYPSEKNNDELLRAIDTLSYAEEVLNEDVWATDLLEIEPVPINPHGLRRVVREVPLSKVQWNGNREEIRRILEPLTREEQNPQEHQAEENMFSFVKFSTPRNYGIFCGEENKSVHGPSGALFSTHDSTSPRSAPFLTQEQAQEQARSSISPVQSDRWTDRFQDLIDFKAIHGHCLVPHTFPSNPKLAQWVKRQRYQHKLKQQKRHCTLTDDRERQLSSLGFVWDSHKASWSERLASLKQFKALYGHCNVPSNFVDTPLAVWVKCQRRQYKLHKKGQRSTMTKKRYQDLINVGFDWDPRNLES